MPKASIRFYKGDILDRSFFPDALVNPINCVGIMGKGLALQFKKKFPDIYKPYQRACQEKQLYPGKVLSLYSLEGLTYVVNFPTKNHWREKSKLEYIETGLDDLVLNIQDLNIRSISIPALGCGEGGLNWDDVKPLIVDKLSPLNLVVAIFKS